MGCVGKRLYSCNSVGKRLYSCNRLWTVLERLYSCNSVGKRLSSCNRLWAVLDGFSVHPLGCLKLEAFSSFSRVKFSSTPHPHFLKYFLIHRFIFQISAPPPPPHLSSVPFNFYIVYYSLHHTYFIAYHCRANMLPNTGQQNNI